MRYIYIYNNDSVRALKINDDNITESLSPNIYTINYNDIDGYHLINQKQKFKLPNSLYGSHTNRVERIMDSYNRQSESLGVLLSGIKGTGKTLLIKDVANRMLDNNIPVILVSEAFAGDKFYSFLNNLQECVLIFDEFGKVYPKYPSEDGGISQDSLLSVFDGTQSIKRMILLSENNVDDISMNILGRPGRIKYHYRYGILSEDIINDYCNDNDVSTEFTKDVLDNYKNINSFSFDMLQHIVQEHIQYGDNMSKIIEHLNLKTNTNGYYVKVKSIYLDSQKRNINFNNIQTNKTINLLDMSFNINNFVNIVDEVYNDEIRYLDGRDLFSFDGNVFIFKSKGYTITLNVIEKY